jgi:hypothetical protein
MARPRSSKHQTLDEVRLMLEVAPIGTRTAIAALAIAYALNVGETNARHLVRRIAHLRRSGETDTQLLIRLNPRRTFE